MRLQSLKIRNFRGVKELDWKIPIDQPINILTGAGDSGKSTILEAIHLLLGDRWTVPFNDTDFYKADLSNPIEIKGSVLDLPSSLMRESALGLWLSGLTKTGELLQDPDDGSTVALIISLMIDSNLEPVWKVERVDGQSQQLSQSIRSQFSTFKVEDKNDTQLRWTRTSTLGRLSAKDGSERDFLSVAFRAARQAIDSHKNSALTGLTSEIQSRMNAFGGGVFENIGPGLDTSRSSMGATLALYEGEIPLANFGLGTKRLSSLAIQHMLVGEESIVIFDEIETGLEPHRAVKLMDTLRSTGNFSQVFITTHSPTIVEQAELSNLATVMEKDGLVKVTSLGGSKEILSRLQRSRPSSFLARKIIVTEGATEFGLLRSFISKWDERRRAMGLSTSAGEGLALQHGEGGSEVVPRALILRDLLYEVAIILDNDDRSVDEPVLQASSAGVDVVRWDYDQNTESSIIRGLSEDLLQDLLKFVSDARGTESSIVNELNQFHEGEKLTSIAVNQWNQAGIDIEEARRIVYRTCMSNKWFKSVDLGIQLGKWLLNYEQKLELEDVFSKICRLESFIYSDVTLLASGKKS